jgi:hypothetical protein
MNTGVNSKKPNHVAGFRVGDIVITPRGMHARITNLRLDGKVDAQYLSVLYKQGWATTLDPKLLKRAQT